MSYRRLLTLFSVLLILSLVLVACGGDEDPTATPVPAEEEAPPPEEEEAPPPEEEEAPPPEEEAAEPSGEAGALPPEGSWLARAMAIS